MSLFSSKGQKHIDGHKELTKHEEIISLVSGNNAPKKVYFPTMAPNGKPITFDVKEGDKVKVGTKIGLRSDFYVPIYSSVSGKVVANENVFSPQVGRAIPHVVIENDGKYDEEKPLKTVTLKDSAEKIRDAIKEAGLVGMGGAGFPTYIKYNGSSEIETLLVNGIECEPYLTTDFIVMQQRVDELLLGCEYLMKASGAKEAIIAIKVHKDEVKEAVLAKLADHPNIRLVETKDAYPMGWERVLIRNIFHKEYKTLPSEVKVAVNNATTVIELGRTLSTGKTVATRLVTVSGNGIVNPHNVLIPVGTLSNELIKVCGGVVEGDINFIPGGPMCSKAVSFDTFPMLMQMGSITVLKYCQATADACLRCGKCTAHCPAYLQPVALKEAAEKRDVEGMKKYDILSCIECGMCSYICPSKIDVTETIKKGKAIVKLSMPKK